VRHSSIPHSIKNIDASTIACSVDYSITVSRHPEYNHRVIVGMVVKRSMTTDKVTRYCRLRLWYTAILIVYDGVLSEFDRCRKCVRKMTAWQDAFQCDVCNCRMHRTHGTTYLHANYLRSLKTSETKLRSTGPVTTAQCQRLSWCRRVDASTEPGCVVYGKEVLR